MKAATLLSELKQRGIDLHLHGDDLGYRAPQGSLTQEILETIRTQKLELIRELRSQEISHDHFQHLEQMLETEFESKQLDHPYARIVEPVKNSLLQRVGLSIEYVRGEGCFLWDSEGTRYLDCVAQYGGLPFGYNPEPIWDAINRVRHQHLPNVATQSMLSLAGKLAQKLIELLPDSFEHVVFCNSGAEATEVTIKLCRAATQRSGIVSTQQGFHGLTNGALSATGSPGFQDGFFVRCNDFQHVEFGDANALQQLLSANPNRFAAFIVEPIQGEAGIIVPPRGYLQAVREICDQHNVLLVVDEVQTGFGRTGEMFGFEHEAIVPDVVTLAKALGGGLVPCGAVAFRSKAYSIRFGLKHSSTFAGNSLAAAAGLATIEMLEKDNGGLIHQVASVGDLLQTGLHKIQLEHPDLIRSIRGKGLMLAIEFDFTSLKRRNGLLPILIDQQLLLHLVISYLLHRHQIRVAPTFMGRDIIRIEPPLQFDELQCDQTIAAFADTMEVLQSGNTGALLSTMIGEVSSSERFDYLSSQYVAPNAPENKADDREESSGPIQGHFGFLVHLTGLQDLVDFDPSLAIFDSTRLVQLKHQLTRSSEPTVIGVSDFVSSDGICVRGHFVLVPHTPDELLAMERSQAIELVDAAAKVAAAQNVELIGLGGFTSIVSAGGLALSVNQLPPLTSGNAFTAAASMIAIEKACELRQRKLSQCSVAIVGAAGQIGRAISMMVAKEAKHLTLVGRDGSDKRTRQSLQSLSNDLVELKAPQTQIRLASHLSEIASADVVIAVSSATEAFIESEHIKAGAIVCDSSRPLNVSKDIIQSRPDVTWIEGGLVKIPQTSNLDLFAGPTSEQVYACVAESALWAMAPYLGLPAATQILDLATVNSLKNASVQHGFEILM